MHSSGSNDDLVMSLVEQGLAKPEAEREDFLRRECASDADLFDEVLDRIQWELLMNGFLLEPFLPRVLVESPFEVGQVLAGRFHLVREIGQGGMGVVYEAHDKKMEGRRIAVKAAKAGFQWHLPPEARNATKIAHPNVCKTFEIHSASTPRGEVDFLTMEYLDGETLSARIQRDGRLPVDQVRDITRQICDGLDEAHRKGVIHGDLKSSNIILVEGESGRQRPVITDFGLARHATDRLAGAEQSTLYGTAPYMAPELWRGERASAASDIYALGVILFETLSGQLPFPWETDWREYPDLKVTRLRKVAPYVPRRWEAIISRSLDRDPARRPRSAAEVSEALVRDHPGWRIARVAAALLVMALSGLPLAPAPTRDQVRLAVLPFEAPHQQKPLIDATLRKTSKLLAEVRPSGWRFTVIPFSESVRRHLKNLDQACREMSASHVLRGELQWNGEIIVVRAAVVDACSQQTIKEFDLEYAAGDEYLMSPALAGAVTRSLRLPPIRATAETIKAAGRTDYEAGLRFLDQVSQVDAAIDSLQRAVTSDPHSLRAWAALAEACRVKFRLTRETGYRDRAESAARRAESLNPDSAPVCRVMGLLRVGAGQFARATEDFHRAIQLEPSNPDGFIGLARAFERMDQTQEALKALLSAIEVGPRYFKAYQQLGGFYYDRGDYERAVEYLKKVVELIPGNPEGHVILAAPYAKLGRFAEAERELRAALDLRETLDAHVNLGAVLAYQCRYLEAIAHEQRAVALAPNDYMTWVNLGDNYRRTYQPAQTRQAYQRGLDLTQREVSRNPQDVGSRAFLAYLLARLGKRGQAEFEISQSLQMPPPDAQVLRMAALTYEALGQRENTLSVLKSAPSSLIADLSRQPDMTGLITDSRFIALLPKH